MKAQGCQMKCKTAGTLPSSNSDTLLQLGFQKNVRRATDTSFTHQVMHPLCILVRDNRSSGRLLKVCSVTNVTPFNPHSTWVKYGPLRSRFIDGGNRLEGDHRVQMTELGFEIDRWLFLYPPILSLPFLRCSCCYANVCQSHALGSLLAGSGDPPSSHS